ncbi:MAG: hypothetical protein L6R42_006829 [Xanthoria sp. 1 TBL-2021]|nr:MAG: hypothetical protein L6R42_006829 [Xanthoria sp. 1 TBL-2021]
MTQPQPDSAPQFPGGMRTSDLTPHCCCGRNHCAYLEYNDAALRGLEDDLRRAAEAGQSLLARHEAYVLEAEEERRRMAATIDQLECDKKELDASNTRIIEENRSLLDQLEDLNNIVSTSDTHCQSLNATLQSTRQELSRLNALAARTSQLEAQLSFMETEQASLHEKLAVSHDDHRSAIGRWKDAERTIGDLQEQIDRIEAESKEESAHHAEVMDRFERRRDVERQLENAAGRLKGAAAATTLGKCSDGNNNMVSHFVKDILADNASLQMGIMELREMLMGSNEEVQKLRQLMMDHQEVPADEHADSSKTTLENDLERSPPAEPDAACPPSLPRSQCSFAAKVNQGSKTTQKTGRFRELNTQIWLGDPEDAMDAYSAYTNPILCHHNTFSDFCQYPATSGIVPTQTLIAFHQHTLLECSVLRTQLSASLNVRFSIRFFQTDQS